MVPRDGRELATAAAGMRRIWRQNEVPVVYRDVGSVLLRWPPPYALPKWAVAEFRLRKQPVRIGAVFGHYEFSGSCFTRLTQLALRVFPRCYVIQTYQEKQRCVPACANAKGIECRCSCLGENHGSNSERWYAIENTIAVQWRGRPMRVSLLARRAKVLRPAAMGAQA